MNNPFDNRVPSLSGPSADLEPVAPNDTTDLPAIALGLYIEGAGVVTFVSARGQTRVVNVSSFAILPTGAKRVMATGTTATGIHAFTV